MRLYRALACLALAVYAPFAFLRSLAGGRRLGDVAGRLGRRPYPDLTGGIWIHAVSVGELGVARNLLRALRRGAPLCPVGISVTTAAGLDLATRTLSTEASIFSFPFELSRAVDRALTRTRPSLVVLTETEIWPLFLARAASLGIPVALVNGRISTRSFARYRLVHRFLAASLSRISLFAMQSAEDARRIETLGAPRERVFDLGNIKYDLPESPRFADGDRLARAAAGRAVLVAGSTGEGEEERILEAWSRLRQRVLLVLAPRRPERFDEIARLCERRGLRLLRRSQPETRESRSETPADVYLLDSIGELAAIYGEATLAFIGGSLVDTGGQNPIEAWAAGIPVVAGPHMENFPDIAARGLELRILLPAADPAQLSDRIEWALNAPEEISRLGREAARFVAANRGAAERTAAAMLAVVPAFSGLRASAP